MNNLPNRQSMRLKHYDYSQNGYYFITICTYERQPLFGEIVGATLCGRPNNPAQLIEKWLFELENKFCDVKICEFVIMPDHIHCIISKTGDHAGSPLREVVGRFKTMTTNEYIANVKNNIFLPFNKKMWQRNYYEHVIRSENDYIKTVEYMVNNPLRYALLHENENGK